MADPNRPVTGYPAPNPNPNDYSANPPPSGTAYAYAAPPQSGYYNYYQNYPQYYQQDQHAIRRATCLRRIFAFVVGLAIIFGAVTFIVWLFLRPQLPEFRVDSLSVSNFSLGNNSLISFNSRVGFTVRNPNKKMSLDYDEMVAMFGYKSESLADTTVRPFFQEKGNETSLTADFVASGRFVNKYVMEGINGERGKDGNVKFNLKMASWVRFEAKAWRARARFLRVYCEELVVGVPSNGTSGMLIGGPKQCHVGI